MMKNDSKKEFYILTVDDDEDFNYLLKLQVSNLGHKIVTTTKVEDFFEKLKTSTPDLCIVDLNLSDKKGAGFQVVRAIRNTLGGDLPIFVMSFRTDGKDISYSMEIGANDYLAKPLKTKDLENKINSHLLTGSNVSELNAEDEKYYQVFPSLAGSTLSFDFKVREINEYGMRLAAKQLIPKDTLVSLGGSIISELFGSESFFTRISTSKLDNSTGMYEIFIEFDVLDKELMANVKKFLYIYRSKQEKSSQSSPAA